MILCIYCNCCCSDWFLTLFGFQCIDVRLITRLTLICLFVCECVSVWFCCCYLNFVSCYVLLSRLTKPRISFALKLIAHGRTTTKFPYNKYLGNTKRARIKRSDRIAVKRTRKNKTRQIKSNTKKQNIKIILQDFNHEDFELRIISFTEFIFESYS